MPTLTSIIVPVWRGGQPPPIARLVNSAVATVNVPWELIVVCNGADPSLLEYLQSETRVTRSAILSQNAGVARGWNIGLHLALGEFLVFVNEDVVLGSGCIDALVEALRNDSTLAMVGPRGARWEITDRDAKHIAHVFGDGVAECDAVSGFLFATPQAALVAAGGFDDAYAPCSFEEIDVAQAFRRLGTRVCALGGLRYEHEWGVSAEAGDREIEWLGRRESLRDIGLRNSARLMRKWGSAGEADKYGARYYSDDYFTRGGYIDIMTRPRTIGGRVEPPLVETMADVIEATGLLPSGGRFLDVGCSYGFLVEELMKRGYDAYGVDFSPDVLQRSPVRERLWCGNALQIPLDQRYDVVFAGDIYEHLNDSEARALTLRIGAITDRLVAIINKSRHEPSHVNIKSNRRWLRLLAEGGFGLEVGATWRGRAQYLRRSTGTEFWHVSLLALSKSASTPLRRIAARLGADGQVLWRAFGEVRRLLR